MSDGKLVEQATPDEFFTAPKSERAQDFLSKILTH
jgi:glutamate transport system ATP-binding protein